MPLLLTAGCWPRGVVSPQVMALHYTANDRYAVLLACTPIACRHRINNTYFRWFTGHVKEKFHALISLAAGRQCHFDYHILKIPRSRPALTAAWLLPGFERRVRLYGARYQGLPGRQLYHF